MDEILEGEWERKRTTIPDKQTNPRQLQVLISSFNGGRKFLCVNIWRTGGGSCPLSYTYPFPCFTLLYHSGVHLVVSTRMRL